MSCRLMTSHHGKSGKVPSLKKVLIPLKCQEEPQSVRSHNAAKELLTQPTFPACATRQAPVLSDGKEYVDYKILLSFDKRILSMRNNLKKITIWSLQIPFKAFRVDVFSDEECYREFCLQPKDINSVAYLGCRREKQTKRRGYIVDPVTAVCTAFRQLAFLTRWMDFEIMIYTFRLCFLR